MLFLFTFHPQSCLLFRLQLIRGHFLSLCRTIMSWGCKVFFGYYQRESCFRKASKNTARWWQLTMHLTPSLLRGHSQHNQNRFGFASSSLPFTYRRKMHKMKIITHMKYGLCSGHPPEQHLLPSTSFTPVTILQRQGKPNLPAQTLKWLQRDLKTLVPPQGEQVASSPAQLFSNCSTPSNPQVILLFSGT